MLRSLRCQVFLPRLLAQDSELIAQHFALTLPLLMPRIFAEDPDNASPPHHFTFGTNRLDRRFDLHGRLHSYLKRYVMRPLVRS